MRVEEQEPVAPRHAVQPSPKMAGGIVIRGQKPAVRCEICHQSDLFNPETGECRRCAAVAQMGALKPATLARAVGDASTSNVHSEEITTRAHSEAMDVCTAVILGLVGGGAVCLIVPFCVELFSLCVELFSFEHEYTRLLSLLFVMMLIAIGKYLFRDR